MIVIGGSVGLNGKNRPEDVAKVRARLVELGFDWIAGRRDVGPTFIKTIKLFQAIKEGQDVVSGSRIDGRVDPGGDTLKWLNATNAPRWVEMTVAAPGLENHEARDGDDGHDWGTDWLDHTLVGAAFQYQEDWRTGHPSSPPIAVNDASLPQGGDTPIHKGHETGLVCDLRLPRKDGQVGGITTADSDYDRDTMRAQLLAIRTMPLFDVAYLNDEVLIDEGLCEPLGGHDNHVHVEIKRPARI